MSTPISFVTLGPDDYDRAKKVLNKAKHPGFIGREFMFRCATKGVVALAVLDGQDVGVVMVDHKHTLQTLSVVESAQGRGVESALTRHVRDRATWVKAIATRISLFERLGYRCVGAPEIGAAGKMSTQLLQRDDAANIDRDTTHEQSPVSPLTRSHRSLEGLSLLDFIPRLSPQHRSPIHLKEWCALIERAAITGVRALCDVPIRHYKTETTLHGIVWLLVQDPSLEIIFLTHTQEAANDRGKRLRQLAEGAGVGPVKGTNTIAHWKNDAGGGVVVMSAAQSKIGYNCHVLVADDPIDEDAANDAALRDAVDQTIAHYSARCMRRGKPGAVLLLMSRWHPDDPIGRRLARGGWAYEHHPVINEDGTAFAPEVWPLEELEKMRREMAQVDPSERWWHAQLMGDPQPEGLSCFGDPMRYVVLPTWQASRTLKGVDFAYSKEKHADYFACCVLRLYGSMAYLVVMRRERLDVNAIEGALRSLDAEFPGPWFSYQSGPEIGITNVLLERGVSVARMQARYNKLVRAERTIHRWNNGKIVVPEERVAPWAKGFTHRAKLFRGYEKDADDEIDALVSACDGGWGAGVGMGPTAKRLGTLAGKV